MDGEEFDLDKVIEAEVKKKTAPAAVPVQPAPVQELSPFESMFSGANAETIIDKFFSGARGLIQDYSGLVQQAAQNQIPPAGNNQSQAAPLAAPPSGDAYDNILQIIQEVQHRYGDLTLSQVHALLVGVLQGVEQAHGSLGDQKLSQVETLMKQHPLIARQLLNSKLSQMQQPQQQQATPPPAAPKLDGDAA